MHSSSLSWRYIKENLNIKATIHKTEGLLKWPIFYLRHLKYCHATWKTYVYKINQVELDGISANMAAKVQTVKSHI